MVNRTHAFNPKTFLTTVGAGRRLISFTKGQTIYAQGDAADSVFVVQSGSVKLSVKSHAGKEATLDILSKADFVGKDSIAGRSIRTASASAITDCSVPPNYEDRYEARAVAATEVGKSVLGVRVGQEHSIPAGFSGSALQPEREETSTDPAVARTLRRPWRARNNSSRDKPCDAGRNGRDHAIAYLLFHEQVQEIGLYLLPT
jgi:hypothetical protein